MITLNRAHIAISHWKIKADSTRIETSMTDKTAIFHFPTTSSRIVYIKSPRFLDWKPSTFKSSLQLLFTTLYYYLLYILRSPLSLFLIQYATLQYSPRPQSHGCRVCRTSRKPRTNCRSRTKRVTFHLTIQLISSDAEPCVPGMGIGC